LPVATNTHCDLSNNNDKLNAAYIVTAAAPSARIALSFASVCVIIIIIIIIITTTTITTTMG